MKNIPISWKMSEILKKFEKIEKKLKLDQSKIKNVTWWDAVRYPLFLEILAELGLRQKKSIKKNSIKFFLLYLIRIIRNLSQFIFSKSPMRLKKNSYLIWGHPRRKLENGKFYDIYSDYFIELFNSKNDFSVIENTVNGTHFTPAKTKNLFYAEPLLSLAFILSRLRFIENNHKEFLIVSELERLINKEFSCFIDVEKLVKKKIRSWLSVYTVMYFFLKIKKPKLFFIIVSAGSEAIVAAARSLGIITLELQHGSPARGKLNYDYTSGIKKNTFPDYFLSFGEYWSSGFNLPINQEKIIKLGYPYLQKKILSYSKTKKEDRFLIISQPHNSRDLANFAIKLNNKFKGKIIVEFKPHPQEYNLNTEYFDYLLKSGVIISKKNQDLYETFMRSRWHVGVCSTALYEGLCFGSACFVLKSSGWEHMKKLIDLDLAKVVSSVEDIDFNFTVDKKKLEKIFYFPTKKDIDLIFTKLNNLSLKHKLRSSKKF